jgi:hypothetical protein
MRGCGSGHLYDLASLLSGQLALLPVAKPSPRASDGAAIM